MHLCRSCTLQSSGSSRLWACMKQRMQAARQALPAVSPHRRSVSASYTRGTPTATLCWCVACGTSPSAACIYELVLPMMPQVFSGAVEHICQCERVQQRCLRPIEYSFANRFVQTISCRPFHADRRCQVSKYARWHQCVACPGVHCAAASLVILQSTMLPWGPCSRQLVHA